MLIAMICAGLSLCLIVLGLLFKEYALFINIFAIIFLVVVFVMVICHYKVFRKKQHIVHEKDKQSILNALDKYQHNQIVLAHLKSGDQGLNEIALKVNEIAINDTSLEYGHMYNGEGFFDLIRKHSLKAGLEKFGYVSIYYIKEKLLESDFITKYPHCYVGKYAEHYDLMLDAFDKNELETYLKDFVTKYPHTRVRVYYYDEYSLDEIQELLKEEPSESITIFDRNIDKEVFNNVINKYRNIDLGKENLLRDYLLDILPHVPFTHMGVMIDDQYIRLVSYKGMLQIDEINEQNYFKTWLKLSGIKYLDKQVYVIFASDKEEVGVTPQLLYKLNKVIAIINSLMIIEIDRQKVEEADSRFNKLEELFDSMSYEVDDDFKVVYATKKLSQRYNNKLVGSYCYECLYDREEPCKDCPLRKGDNCTFLMSSHLYKRVVEKDGDKATIYLLSQKKPFINDRDALDDRLLGLINSDAKGYLLVFKLDALTQMAAKKQKSVEEVVGYIVQGLNIYGLTNNLFRKSEDEFVYILENASVSDAVRISKDVSRLFLETFEVDDSDFSFLPKVILLSYPLEVNTLFSLDSLSRTLFNNVTKKGCLYRIDEDPLSIDDHRYYMEVVEESYKKGEIPFTYRRVKDASNKEKYYYASLNYMDQNHNPIPENQITLYTKIDNTYLTLVDKAIRGLDYENDYTFLLPLGKEGLTKKLFDTLMGFFSTKKISPNRIIFEGKEKDLNAHMEDVQKAIEMGFRFAVDVNDNYNHNLDLSLFDYIRVDGKKLDTDKGYQNKVNELFKQKVDVLIEDKYKDLLTEVRYTI